jgi:glycosyltransferase involved in cell wall biosynthesis
VKRPDWFLDLAEACPDLRFDLVGPSDDQRYATQVLDRARTIPNVRIHGAVARERVHDLYRSAACLCSTSLFEGFPNTFLEAWSQGLPIVSTFDPDGLIAGRGLGRVACDLPGLARELREVLSDLDWWTTASRAARRYYVENHTVEAAMPLFERMLTGKRCCGPPSG